MTLIFRWCPAVASFLNSLSLKFSVQKLPKTNVQFFSCEMNSDWESFVSKNVKVTFDRAEFGLLMLIELIKVFYFLSGMCSPVTF